MPGIIDQIEAQKTRDENAGIAQAARDATWANTFNSIPPVEKLRANLNVTNAIAGAVQRKMELDSQTSLKAMQLRAATAEFEAKKEQRPLQEQLLKARIEATGATERRKAAAAITEAEQTARLNTGFLKLHQSGAQPGSPEFQAGAIDLIASNPYAHTDHVAELGKMAGFSQDLTPEQYVSEAVKIKKAATDAGLSNPTIKSFSGRPTVVEGASVITPEQSIDNAVKRKLALKAVDAPKVDKPAKPDTFEAFNKELAAMVQSYGDASKVPKEKWAEFEKRKAAIGTTPASAVPVDGAVPVAATPNPNQAAIDWVTANPTDPRAAAIKAKLGLK